MNKVFTLATASVAGGATFVVQNAAILQQVSAGAGATQYTLSGVTVTFGVAPLGGDSLYAFTSTSLTLGLKPITITGGQDGSNKTFVLSEAPAANSDLVLFFNTAIQQPVAAGPTTNQFSLSGTTLTLGIAPLASDSLTAYVENTAQTFFRVLTLTGLQDSINSRYTTDFLAPASYTPIFLVLRNGLAFQAVASAPTSTQYVVESAGSVIRLGVSPAAADTLVIYSVGLIAAAATNPLLITQETQVGRILMLLQNNLSDTEVEMVLRAQYQLILESYEWSFRRAEGFFDTAAIKNAGTVQVTQSSQLVIGSSTNWATTDVGKYIRIGTDSAYYKIQSVQVLSATSQVLTLSVPYAAISASSLAYVLFQHVYALDPQMKSVKVMSSSRVPMHEVSLEYLNQISPTKWTTANQVYLWAYRERDANNILQVELYPVPTVSLTVRYVGVKSAGALTGAENLLGVETAVLYAAVHVGCLMVAAKKPTEGTVWLTLAEQYQTLSQRTIQDLLFEDTVTAGLPGIANPGGSFTYSDQFRQAHDINGPGW